MNDTIERSQTHATFVIERTYPVPVEAVWHALPDDDARDQWFSAGPATPSRASTSTAWTASRAAKRAVRDCSASSAPVSPPTRRRTRRRVSELGGTK